MARSAPTVTRCVLITALLLTNCQRTQWIMRYDGEASGRDEAVAVAVDHSGNAYVTGSSIGPSGTRDYLTLSYDPWGRIRWVARYNSGGDDSPTAVAANPVGHVFVTGRSNGMDAGFDYLTVAYDSTGTLRWARRYNGAGNGDDEATALCLGPDGSPYVTGRSVVLDTGFDYMTLHYNTDGDLLWQARYDDPMGGGFTNEDTPTAIAVDSLGRAYVTGYSDHHPFYVDFGYATVQYDIDGTERWVARYDGQGYDYARALVVDSSSHVYVTGNTLTSENYSDILTISYDEDGNERWRSQYDGSAHLTDAGFAITLDASQQHIIVAGFTTKQDWTRDVCTVRITHLGQEVWVRTYDGPAGGQDEARAVAVDEFERIFIAGQRQGTGTANDYMLLCYDPGGNLLWEETYNGTGNGDDVAMAIATDRRWSVTVTGISLGSASDMDYATIRYLALP